MHGVVLSLGGRAKADLIRQSVEPDQAKRRALVFDIERRLEEDGARITMYYNRTATCWHPRVKGVHLPINSIYNGWRFENVWLE